MELTCGCSKDLNSNTTSGGGSSGGGGGNVEGVLRLALGVYLNLTLHCADRGLQPALSACVHVSCSFQKVNSTQEQLSSPLSETQEDYVAFQ